MALSNRVRFVDRVQFFNGQPLLATDLQALEEYQREMRWLHNRSLHQPGVASGFAVQGEKGDPVLVVQPGYAIDALGRELVLAEPHTEPVPPVAGDSVGNPVAFDLTVSYSDTLRKAETRTAVCEQADGAVRLSEAPVFCWARVGDPDGETLRQQIETGERILLARISVLNCQLYQRVSITQRRNAKPSLHPLVFAEMVKPVWVIDEEVQFPFGLRLKPVEPIDTRAAGFRTSPSYFVNLVDANVQLETEGGPIQVPLDGFIEITHVEPERFNVAWLIPRLLFEGDANYVFEVLRNQAKAGELDFAVEWLGVEG